MKGNWESLKKEELKKLKKKINFQFPIFLMVKDKFLRKNGPN